MFMIMIMIMIMMMWWWWKWLRDKQTGHLILYLYYARRKRYLETTNNLNPALWFIWALKTSWNTFLNCHSNWNHICQSKCQRWRSLGWWWVHWHWSHPYFTWKTTIRLTTSHIIRMRDRRWYWKPFNCFPKLSNTWSTIC